MQLHEPVRFAMAAPLTLISHKLCPYVQRAVIALAERGTGFERIDIDLANKPDWFLAISPLGKTPVLQVGDVPIFESAVILEYLEETQPKPLHPADPLTRAEHRAGSNSDRRFSMTSRDFTRRRATRPSRPRQRNSSSVLRGLNRASRPRHGLTAKVFRWSTRCSVRCFAISMCSTKSRTLGFSQASRRLRVGATASRRGRRCARQLAPITRHCFAISSIGGIPGCQAFKPARPPDYLQ
jgi:hypothetical protein